jgi:hypothetical protein
MNEPQKNRALRIIKKAGLARATHLETQGIPRATLYQLLDDGLVIREARGIYTATDHTPTAEHTLAHVATRVPSGVFCLLTALRFTG